MFWVKQSHIQTLKAALENVQIKLIQQMMEAKKYIQDPKHIQNTVKHLLRNILFRTFCSPDMFRTLAYSLFWDILKSKHNQN